MSVWWWLGVGLLAWCALSAAVGLVVGPMLRRAGTAPFRLSENRALGLAAGPAGRRRRTRSLRSAARHIARI